MYTLLLCFLIVIKYNKLCMGLLSLSYRVKRMPSKAKFFDYVKHLFCYGGHKRTINRLAMYISLLAKRAFVKQGVRQGCILNPTLFLIYLYQIYSITWTMVICNLWVPAIGHHGVLKAKLGISFRKHLYNFTPMIPSPKYHKETVGRIEITSI